MRSKLPNKRLVCSTSSAYLIIREGITCGLSGEATAGVHGMDVSSILHQDVLLDTVHQTPELLLDCGTRHHLEYRQHCEGLDLMTTWETRESKNLNINFVTSSLQYNEVPNTKPKFREIHSEIDLERWRQFWRDKIWIDHDLVAWYSMKI